MILLEKDRDGFEVKLLLEKDRDGSEVKPVIVLPEKDRDSSEVKPVIVLPEKDRDDTEVKLLLEKDRDGSKRPGPVGQSCCTAVVTRMRRNEEDQAFNRVGCTFVLKRFCTQAQKLNNLFYSSGHVMFELKRQGNSRTGVDGAGILMPVCFFCSGRAGRGSSPD